MRWRVLLLIFLFTISFANASVNSDTKTDFSMSGCIYNGESVAHNSCSTDGEYYCTGNLNSKLFKTRTKESACKMGKDNFEAGEDPQCCPSGYICSGNDPNKYRCRLRIEDCSSKKDMTECRKSGCTWINECVDSPRDYGCDIYPNKQACETDIWNLGKTGLGTKICGSLINEGSDFFAIPNSLCGCTWSNKFGEKCVLSYTVQPDIYSSKINDPEPSFTCYKSFTGEGCLNGEETVRWQVSLTDKGTYSRFDEIHKKAECEDGHSTRVCGKPVIKMPGFSFFSLISALSILTFFYIVSIRSHQE